MPSYVIKPDRDLDQYVYWSEIVDAPHINADRATVRDYIDSIGDGPAEVRMERADSIGTSALWGNPRVYSWDDPNRSVIYHQQGIVKLDDLWEFCERLGRGEPVDDLVEPFEDDE